MPIPQFQKLDGEEFGVLPEGIYPCSNGDFFRRFVSQFPLSSTRLRIWTGFSKLLFSLTDLDIAAVLWVDESFVTDKSDPNDVDVVAFILSEDVAKATADAIAFLKRISKGAYCQSEFLTHFFIVPMYDKSDPRYKTYWQARSYWRKWWGQTRGGDRKGFVEMPLGEVTQFTAEPK